MAKYWGQQASGLLIYNKKGQVLLLQRSQDVMGGNGEFAIAGGRVDDGETPKQSANKEGHEEMGGVPKGKFTGSFVFKKPLNVGDIVHLSSRTKRIEKTGENFEYHTFYYLTDEDDWEPRRLNWENDDFKWFDAQDAANSSKVFAPIRDMLKKGFLPHFTKQKTHRQEKLKFEDVARGLGLCRQMS